LDLLAGLRGGEIDEVVAYDQSRLTRQPAEWEQLMVILARRRIAAILTVREGDRSVPGLRRCWTSRHDRGGSRSPTRLPPQEPSAPKVWGAPLVGRGRSVWPIYMALHAGVGQGGGRRPRRRHRTSLSLSVRVRCA
jgi:hypothetical protein